MSRTDRQQLRHLAIHARGGTGDDPVGSLRRNLERLAETARALFPTTGLQVLSYCDGDLEEAVVRGLPPSLEEALAETLRDLEPPPGVVFGVLSSGSRLPPGAAREAAARRGPLDPRGRHLLWFLDYRGREEIVEAVRRMAGAGDAAGTLAGHLLTAGLPDPDLLILSGEEPFLPDFLVYQISYSEIFHTGRPWGEFTPGRLEEALESFRRRERRYGRI